MHPVNHTDIAQLIDSVTDRGQRHGLLTQQSRLLGAVPELDSMAIINLIVALEKRYGFRWHDDEMEESTFTTLGSLTDFVQGKVVAAQAMRASATNQIKR